ncbi:hypothetical protein C8R45DRAFT_941362 [Mycena sanguinolenta]|nr:hypothetical protein C8R45DRAFT_941362 [Mycena sanguinolenta]
MGRQTLRPLGTGTQCLGLCARSHTVIWPRAGNGVSHSFEDGVIATFPYVCAKSVYAKHLCSCAGNFMKGVKAGVKCVITSLSPRKKRRTDDDSSEKENCPGSGKTSILPSVISVDPSSTDPIENVFLDAFSRVYDTYVRPGHLCEAPMISQAAAAKDLMILLRVEKR